MAADCCDGSDEYATGVCEDTCEEAGRLAKIEADKERQLQSEVRSMLIIYHIQQFANGLTSVYCPLSICPYI